MSKLSVLDMAQDIASDMNSDEISSITDTVESLQIAQIIKSTYEEMMSRKNWPHLQKLISLTPSNNLARPTHMSVPTTIKEVVSISYDKRKTNSVAARIQEVEYKYPDDFLRLTNSRNTNNDNIMQVTDISGVTLLIRTDAAPSYYTSFDDENIVFDSYNRDIDDTLQESKTQVLAYISPTFTLADSFVPDLPIEMFSVLLAEAKSACFTRIKQAPDGKAEQQARRGMSWASRNAWQVKGGWRFPDYGRRGKK